LLAASFPNDPASFDGIAFEASVGHLLLHRVHRFVFVDIGRHHNPVLLQLINLRLPRYFLRHVVVCHTATLVPPGVGPLPHHDVAFPHRHGRSATTARGQGHCKPRVIGSLLSYAVRARKTVDSENFVVGQAVYPLLT
jgi:hypothetical protein